MQLFLFNIDRSCVTPPGFFLNFFLAIVSSFECSEARITSLRASDIEVEASLIYSSSAFRAEPGLTVWFLLELLFEYKTLQYRKYPVSDRVRSFFFGSVLEEVLEGSFHHVRSKTVALCHRISKTSSLERYIYGYLTFGVNLDQAFFRETRASSSVIIS